MAISLSTIGAGIDHPESICWDPAGSIVVGTESGGLLWLDPSSGNVQNRSQVGQGLVAGIAIDGQGRAYACISPDGKYLYVVESSLPGVSRLRLQADGSAGARELVVEMPRHVPDGLAFAADGLLLISCYRPDVIYRWDGANLEILAEDWTGLVLSAPTIIAFTGDDLD